MLGHYFYFLSYFNRNIFTFLSVVLANWKKINLKKLDDVSGEMVIVGALINLLYPLLIYVCIKFGYHFPLELACGVVAMSVDPIFYFLNTFGFGNLSLVLNRHSELYMAYFSGTSNHHFWKQWQYTIIIVDIMLAGIKVVYLLVESSQGNMTFPVIISLALGVTLFGFSKEYLALYVDLSKI